MRARHTHTLSRRHIQERFVSPIVCGRNGATYIKRQHEISSFLSSIWAEMALIKLGFQLCVVFFMCEFNTIRCTLCVVFCDRVWVSCVCVSGGDEIAHQFRFALIFNSTETHSNNESNFPTNDKSSSVWILILLSFYFITILYFITACFNIVGGTKTLFAIITVFVRVH